MNTFIVELDGFEPFIMDNSIFREDCLTCKCKDSVAPYYLHGNINTKNHVFDATCSKCGGLVVYTKKKQFKAVCDYLYRTRSNIKNGGI